MKRKQYIDWLAAVFGIFGTVYGAYLLVWHYNRGNGLLIPALVLLILGGVSLLFAIALLTSRFIASKKKRQENPTKPEEPKEEPKPEKETEEQPVEEPKPQPTPVSERNDYVERSPRSSYSYSAPSTVYVKEMGRGPLLRIEGTRILDMRDNTYYRIEDNMVFQEGYGPRYEIRGDQIKDAFGGYLYELSGSNINKVYGGFYASVSAGYITLHDSSRKFEMTGALSRKQLLATTALLFGR